LFVAKKTAKHPAGQAKNNLAQAISKKKIKMV
jgi:hypothetical protein